MIIRSFHWRDGIC